MYQNLWKSYKANMILNLDATLLELNVTFCLFKMKELIFAKSNRVGLQSNCCTKLVYL